MNSLKSMNTNRNIDLQQTNVQKGKSCENMGAY